ncbi:hypothetical protein PIB30_012728 [Stylosanthes scabra]|uniref:Uncharacterized protein n=1 Tax=Stylosanthes scabra TaxID=79078 RepID=A0ABU6R705_9FABA|nr:hypothetical protein [Stylosanthes scabra]
MECENNETQKGNNSTLTQVEAAWILTYIKNHSTTTTTEEEDEEDQQEHSSSNNSNSLQEWKQPVDEVSVSSISSSSEIEDVLADIEEDETLRRSNKRYRYVHELYTTTQPLSEPAVKANNNTMMFIKLHY